MASPATLFISDLHLAPGHPAPARLFHRFIAEIAPGAAGLYILGDFFDAWVGDDDLTHPFHADILSQIKQLTERGVPAFLLPGNRDFLMGEDLARTAGLTLLPDPSVIQLYGQPTLIAHGDQFCTDDTSYQAFRNQVRNPVWQSAFLSKSLEERRTIAQSLRQQSEQSKAGKLPEIMDVNREAMEHAFRSFGVNRIIHGHTHRPSHHRLTLDGVERERWVLSDWGTTAGYLACDKTGCRPFTLA